MLIVKTRFTLIIKVYAPLTVPRGQCEQEIYHGLVLAIPGRHRYGQCWRSGLSRNRFQEGLRHRRGPFFLSGARIAACCRMTACQCGDPHRKGVTGVTFRSGLPIQKFRFSIRRCQSRRKPAERLARRLALVHQPRRDESNYRRVESPFCHLPSCIIAPTWHYRWWVTHGGTPINSIRLQLADFRRPSHMGTGKPSLRPKKVPTWTGLDARVGASP